ncbi:hypothetical protein MBM_01565 [Drepanopeziza brunnea f. sp. 'multigermtubi' MB_m1]|uniref:Uncharacterized protein n=1 Tax=Marssonina brunnea f. sp. multigermtubi (strain MB_m1) TaxID=1072389 RepID=K1XJL6_MARBU|nr:uncharacterized protein MBM_01565 [Drepanopeziza brunnea f. sp. 'multigermtubi' MB_m1]EKD20883.1 hypothetical protein MBM_01565 [Drepanopeziza brunnea f. sp. 'multigermtubi' MB_m1]
MATIRSWRPPGSAYYDGTSSSELLPAIHGRNCSRDAIPKGSVASRIRSLQDFRGSSTPKPTTAVRKYAREASRSGFGRRVNPRFGHPAMQSAQPDEATRIESRHSYLGIQAIRTNHEAEHGIAGASVQYNPAPSINVKMEQELHSTAQYDAIFPRGSLSRTKPTTRSIEPRNGIEPDVLIRINSSGNQSQHLTRTPTSNSTAKKIDADSYRHRVRPRRLDFGESEASIASTSTTRRQDVRDLFEEYGIQRPPGLASREVSRDLGESTCGQPKYCHVCSCSNSHTSMKCWRCSHRLCYICIDHLPSTFEERKDQRQGNSRPKENRNMDNDPVKKLQPRPGPTPLQPRYEQPAVPSRKPSSSPDKFPGFYGPEPDAKPPKRIPSKQDPVIPLRHRTATSVKDNPFIIADLKSSRQSLRLSPLNTQEDFHHTSHHHTKHHRAVNFPSGASEAMSCNSKITLQHIHAAPYQRRPPKKRVPEGTDIGYNADTSQIDYAVKLPSRRHSQISGNNPPFTHFPDSPYSHFTCDSRPDSSDSPVAKTHYVIKHDIPEYVECHGYPRTGHARHGSPISSGVVEPQNGYSRELDPEAVIEHHLITNIDKTDSFERPGPSARSEDVPKADKSQFLTYTSNQWIESDKSTRQEKASVSNANGQTLGKSYIKETAASAKDESTVSRRPSQERSSVDARAERTGGTWFTIPSHHEDERSRQRRESGTVTSRKVSVSKEEKYAASPGICSPRTQGSPPVLRGASRWSSTPSQLNQRKSVQALKAQLLENREQPKKPQKERSQLSERNVVAELAQKIEERGSRMPGIEPSAASIRSIGSEGSKRKKWKLKLVNWNPQGKRKAGKEHNLSADEIVGNNGKADSFKSQPLVSATNLNWMDELNMGGKEPHSRVDAVVKEDVGPEHQSVWKKGFEEVSRNKTVERGYLGIVGITVLVHLVGREDLVARAESLTGGGLKEKD